MVTKVFFFIAPLIFLCAGGLIALIVERFDTALRTITDVVRATKLSFIGTMPRMQPQSPNHHLKRQQAGRYLFAESSRSLATLLLRSTPSQKILQITSALPSAGKTTIACNLARALTENGQRVLLIDADLRRPNVHPSFGLRNSVGLSSILESKNTLEEVLQQVPEVPRLDILTAGPVPPFPSALLDSEDMRSLFKRCLNLYDHIVLDSPPVLSAVDGITLAMQSKAVILVIRYGDATRSVLRARDLLLRSGVSITGFVLNATPPLTDKDHS